MYVSPKEKCYSDKQFNFSEDFLKCRSPTALTVEFPAALTVEFPAALTVEFPAALTVEFPAALTVEFPAPIFKKTRRCSVSLCAHRTNFCRIR